MHVICFILFALSLILSCVLMQIEGSTMGTVINPDGKFTLKVLDKKCANFLVCWYISI
jgi:uncharacterized membrane protein